MGGNRSHCGQRESKLTKICNMKSETTEVLEVQVQD